jgi:hypothetical protein
MAAKSEYVYVIRGTRHGHKVGIAVDPQKRLGFLRCDGALEVVKTWHRPDDARAVEYHVRQLLEPLRSGSSFEWFDAPIDALIAAVETAIEMVECGRAFQSPTTKAKARAAAKAKWWAEWRTERDKLAAEIDKWAAENPDEFEAELKRLTEFRLRT